MSFDQELAEILRLLGAFGKKLELGELGDAVDELSDFLAELLLDVLVGDMRVLDRVVEERGDDGRHIELQIRQDRGHFQRVCKIGIAGRAHLLAMRRQPIGIGLVEERHVGVGIVGLHPRDQIRLAHDSPRARLCVGRRRGRGNGGDAARCGGFNQDGHGHMI
jgi:hypothetical protein